MPRFDYQAPLKVDVCLATHTLNGVVPSTEVLIWESKKSVKGTIFVENILWYYDINPDADPPQHGAPVEVNMDVIIERWNGQPIKYYGILPGGQISVTADNIKNLKIRFMESGPPPPEKEPTGRVEYGICIQQ